MMNSNPKTIVADTEPLEDNTRRFNETVQIMLAEDDDSLRSILEDFLKNPRRIIWAYRNGQDAVQALKNFSFDLVITDLMMPGADGLGVLKEAKKANPESVVILMTGYGSLDTALQAIHGGAYDYIRKPFKLKELEIVVNNACDRIFLIRENRHLLGRLKETMEEMKAFKKVQGKDLASLYHIPSISLDHKISELDLILNQMIPPKYDLQKSEQREKALQELERLIQLKKEGFIDRDEFHLLKKMLLTPFRD